MSPEKPPSDTLPYAWLKERLDNIEKRMTDHNQNMRADMSAYFGGLSDQFRAHEREDREVADRVLRIETERATEEKHGRKQGAIAGSIVAGIIMGAFEAIKRFGGGLK